MAMRLVTLVRTSLLALAGMLALVAAGCGDWSLFNPADVTFTFDNQTDTILCEYRSPQAVTAGMCSADLEPSAETRWGRDCDNRTDRPIRLIIATRQGQELYDRTMTCGEWHDTNRTFVIEEVDGEFDVTEPTRN